MSELREAVLKLPTRKCTLRWLMNLPPRTIIHFENDFVYRRAEHGWRAVSQPSITKTTLQLREDYRGQPVRVLPVELTAAALWLMHERKVAMARRLEWTEAIDVSGLYYAFLDGERVATVRVLPITVAVTLTRFGGLYRFTTLNEAKVWVTRKLAQSL